MNYVCVQTLSGDDIYLNLASIHYFAYNRSSDCTIIRMTEGPIEARGNVARTLYKHILATGGTIGDVRAL